MCLENFYTFLIMWLCYRHLLKGGLRIEFFTVALSNSMWSHELGAEACHLSVCLYAKRSKTISEKTLRRKMDTFGALTRVPLARMLFTAS